MANKSSGVVNNLLWKFGERITAQLVTLLISVILARLLEPSHYGVISLVTIFITIANVFISDGFGSALIQKKDADALDFYSVLYFNIFFSVVLYFVLFISAPFISDFFGDGYELFTPVLRVLSLRLLLSAVNSVQQAYVSRQMIFKKFFLATLFGTLVSGIVGVLMAYRGFGVWALVAQYLTNTLIDTVVLNVSLHLKPQFQFSFTKLKKLIPFGARILGAKLLITGYQELRALLIGKVYSASDLAYFDKGKQFPNLIVANIDSSISAVLFPRLSKDQNDLTKIKDMTRLSLRISSFVMCPLMLGLASVARTFVKVILTEKWLPCVPLLQLFCVVFLFMPIHSANMQAIKAIGRSGIYLLLEIIKKTIELIVLLFTIRISVNAIVVSMAAMTILFTFVNAYPNVKLLGYTIKEQINDIVPNFSLALIMSLIVSCANYLFTTDNVLKLCIQIIVGGIVYILLSAVTKNKDFLFLKKYIGNMINKNY